MGNHKSLKKNGDNHGENGDQHCITLPKNAKPWSLVYKGDLHHWITCADNYGFKDYPYLCQNAADCDKEAVCLQIIKAELNTRSKTLRIRKNINGDLIKIYYSENEEFRNLVDTEGYEVNQSALAYREHMVLLVCKYASNFVWNSAFPLLDLKKKEIKNVLNAPEQNMTIHEAEISPDLSKTVILFYYVRDSATQTLGHELFLYENGTGDILDKIFVNAHVNPSIAFDPRCDWTRIAILGYENENLENDMVIFSLSQRTILKKSKLCPMKTFGRGHFEIMYSKDGQLVLLQKMTSGRCKDTYIFDSSELILLKYIPTTMPGMLSCTTSCEPVFSKCGGYMGLINQDNVQDEVNIQVYQLPRVLNLQFQARIVIIQHLNDLDCIDKLHLPSKLLNYLKFKPVEI